MRFLRFKRWLTELKAHADGIDALHFEEVRRHVSTDAAHAYGGFLATWASPEIPDTEIRCKDGLGGVGWVLEGCSLGSSSSRQ